MLKILHTFEVCGIYCDNKRCLATYWKTIRNTKNYMDSHLPSVWAVVFTICLYYSIDYMHILTIVLQKVSEYYGSTNSTLNPNVNLIIDLCPEYFVCTLDFHN